MRIIPDFSSVRWSLKSGVIALCGLFLLVGVVWEVGGFCYDDGDDPVRMVVYNGYFTGIPEYVCNTFGGHILTGIVIQKLYIAYPEFEWYDAWTGASLCLAYLLGAYWLLVNLSRYRIVAVLMFTLIMASNFLVVQITKSAFLISFFALLNMLLPHRERSVAGFLFFYFAFFFGLLTRFDTAFLAVALALPVCLIARMEELKKYLAEIGIIYLSLAPALLFTYHTVNTPITDADRIWNAIRPYSFTLVDWRESTDMDCPVYSKYCTDYSSYCPKTNGDSLILMALQNHFFFDTSFDTKKLDELCVIPKDKLAGDLLNYLNGKNALGEKFMRAAKEFFLDYYYWVFAFALLVIFALLSGKGKTNVARKIILNTLFFLTVILVIATLMKIVDRLMIPVMQSLLIIILYYWISMSEKNLQFCLAQC